LIGSHGVDGVTAAVPAGAGEVDPEAVRGAADGVDGV